MRGRGIDFEHRFKTSRWAEDLLIRALGPKHGLFTTRFGLSEIRPEAQLVYGETSYKEPDLLTYALHDLTDAQLQSLKDEDLESADRIQFTEGQKLHFAFTKALAAIEVEFSPYRAKEMKDRDWQPRALDRWAQKPLKRANPPTAPNVIVKEEDLPKLLDWRKFTKIPIIIVHLFDQEAFAVSLKTIHDFNKKFESNKADQIKLQVTSGIFKTVQRFDRTDAQGAAEEKTIFRVTPGAGIKVGDLRDVRVEAQLAVSSSKKYVTHPIFSGGRLELSSDFVEFLKATRNTTRS
jgi:hypothetical protein